MNVRAWAPALGLLACGACNALVEDNPKFSAGDEPMADVDDGNAETPSSEEGIPDDEPPQPDWLIVDTQGNPDDAEVDPLGPGLLLVGGGMPGDEAYQWQAGLIAGGDIVILQPGGPAPLGMYLYETIGGADSVQTITVPAGATSFEPWIAWAVAHAEAVLIVATDPYDVFWKDTPIAVAIMQAWENGAVIGGIDAGLSSLGDFAYPGYGEVLSSSDALADPYGDDVALERYYLELDLLDDAVLEARFTVDDRMGRLLAFAARVLEDDWSNTVIGMGIDDNTAMTIGPDGLGEVHGEGHVYLFRTQDKATMCEPETMLEFGPVTVSRLADGDRATWPGGHTEVEGTDVLATGGQTDPASPY